MTDYDKLELDTETLYRVYTSSVSHFYAVCEPSNNQGWYKYYTQKRARAAHPTLTNSITMSEKEWIGAVYRRSSLPVVSEDEGAVVSDEEKHYWVCMGCGEAFEVNEDANLLLDHFAKNCDHTENYSSPSFELLPESEAF
jgi:hypothetical protein